MNKASQYSFAPLSSEIKPVSYSYHGKHEKHPFEGISTVKFGALHNSHLILDFGREIGGRFRISWGKVPCGAVTIVFSESLDKLYPFGDSIWPLLDAAPGAGVHIYSGFGNCDWRDPVLRGGFRYAMLSPVLPLECEIKQLFIEPDFYIPDGGIYDGAFECSDNALNRIWHAAAYTMQVSTKHPYESFVFGNKTAGTGEWVLMDGAKRDRSVWTFDLAVATPSYLLSIGNAQVIKDSLLSLLERRDRSLIGLRKGYIPHSCFPSGTFQDVFDSTQVFSVYLLWWIRCVYSIFLYHGDIDFARGVFREILDAFAWMETQTRKSPQSGTPLFYASGRNDLSWDYTIHRTGFSSATNIIWAVALEETSKIAETIGRIPEAEMMKGRADAIRRAVFERGFMPFELFDHSQGLFRHTTRDRWQTPLEANAFAVLYGFLDGPDADNCLDILAVRNHVPWGSLSSDRKFPGLFNDWHNAKVIPCLVAFEVAALMKRMRFDEALALTRNCWMNMLDQDPHTTFWEWTADEGKPGTSFMSRCHPWSADILQFLTEGLSGITPVSPGYTSFNIDASFSFESEEIKHAEFSIPTPYGNIDAVWIRKGNRIEYQAEYPSGLDPIINMCEGIDIANSIGGKRNRKKSRNGISMDIHLKSNKRRKKQ